MFQKFHRRGGGGDGVVGGVEDLEAQSLVVGDGEVTHLTQITGVDVGPRVAFAGVRSSDVLGEIGAVLFGGDDVADDEGVDVGVEAAGEGAGDAFSAQLAAGVGVHGVAVVGVFVQGEGGVGQLVVGTLGETDPIRSLGRGDHNPLYPEFARRFDHVVRRQHIAPERLAVRYQHVARVCGEVDHRVRHPRVLREGVFRHVEE